MRTIKTEDDGSETESEHYDEGDDGEQPQPRLRFTSESLAASGDAQRPRYVDETVEPLWATRLRVAIESLSSNPVLAHALMRNTPMRDVAAALPVPVVPPTQFVSPFAALATQYTPPTTQGESTTAIASEPQGERALKEEEEEPELVGVRTPRVRRAARQPVVLDLTGDDSPERPIKPQSNPEEATHAPSTAEARSSATRPLTEQTQSTQHRVADLRGIARSTSTTTRPTAPRVADLRAVTGERAQETTTTPHPTLNLSRVQESRTQRTTATQSESLSQPARHNESRPQQDTTPRARTTTEQPPTTRSATSTPCSRPNTTHPSRVETPGAPSRREPTYPQPVVTPRNQHAPSQPKRPESTASSSGKSTIPASSSRESDDYPSTRAARSNSGLTHRSNEQEQSTRRPSHGPQREGRSNQDDIARRTRSPLASRHTQRSYDQFGSTERIQKERPSTPRYTRSSCDRSPQRRRSPLPFSRYRSKSRSPHRSSRSRSSSHPRISTRSSRSRSQSTPRERSTSRPRSLSRQSKSKSKSPRRVSPSPSRAASRYLTRESPREENPSPRVVTTPRSSSIQAQSPMPSRSLPSPPRSISFITKTSKKRPRQAAAPVSSRPQQDPASPRPPSKSSTRPTISIPSPSPHSPSPSPYRTAIFTTVEAAAPFQSRAKSPTGSTIACQACSREIPASAVTAFRPGYCDCKCCGRSYPADKILMRGPNRRCQYCRPNAPTTPTLPEENDCVKCGLHLRAYAIESGSDLSVKCGCCERELPERAFPRQQTTKFLRVHQCHDCGDKAAMKKRRDHSCGMVEALMEPYQAVTELMLREGHRIRPDEVIPVNCHPAKLRIDEHMDKINAQRAKITRIQDENQMFTGVASAIARQQSENEMVDVDNRDFRTRTHKIVVYAELLKSVKVRLPRVVQMQLHKFNQTETTNEALFQDPSDALVQKRLAERTPREKARGKTKEPVQKKPRHEQQSIPVTQPPDWTCRVCFVKLPVIDPHVHTRTSCACCHRKYPSSSFSRSQLTTAAPRRRCKACINAPNKIFVNALRDGTLASIVQKEKSSYHSLLIYCTTHC